MSVVLYKQAIGEVFMQRLLLSGGASLLLFSRRGDFQNLNTNCSINTLYY